MKTIESVNYHATPEQVQTLARERLTVDNQSAHIDGTYLRVLVASMQSLLDKNARRRIAGHLRALDEVDARFYPAVLKGITTADIAHDDSQTPEEQSRRAVERNRRSTFARSAKSTLAAFIRASGDVRELDVALTTKASLRAVVHEALSPEERDEAAIEGAKTGLVRLLRKRASESPAQARARLRSVIADLQEVLGEISGSKVVSIKTRYRKAA